MNKYKKQLGWEAAVGVFIELTRTLFELQALSKNENVNWNELCLCAEEQGFLPHQLRREK